MPKTSIPATIRIPSELEVKINAHIGFSNGTIKNRSQAIIELLNYAFGLIEENKNKLIEDIESTFSVENKVFMPINVYKKLVTKSNYTIQEELSRGTIEEISINKVRFIIIEAPTDTSAIIVELLVQKKDIELLNRKINSLKDKK